jgi:hypothetical protein
MHKPINQSIADEIVAEVVSSSDSSLVGSNIIPNPKKILKVAHNPAIQKVGGILCLGLIVYGIASYFAED